ncbi:hypothetical protein, variant [Verruconis gallopava]|uniref:Uncharacterized protein n=1 Tax=Verruconis gallopava TaxID=253628 RepID=A0A0D1ZVF0_9PEZI|nr:uncharacterized protein PV09_09737 [Verruconis gallopava]XP_016208323.1 hypothetical protein, variant [Verruconis gallopava]KIV98452.1 hypothetical protein PV09_09737 [Verruconis gallopava]KIV98453.1 hypothetical protein, variant [Verruconis gallopava]
MMSVLSSPSPTLSPNPGFAHDQPHHNHHHHHQRSSFASLRRSTSSSHRSYRLSPSSSQAFPTSHASSPASSIHSSATSNLPTSIELTPTSAPKRRAVDEGGRGYALSKPQTVDAGTQYSPTDYPPTAHLRRPAMACLSRGQDAQVHTTATDTARNVGVGGSGSEDVDLVNERLERTESCTPPEPSLRQDPRPHTPTAASSSSASVSVASSTSNDLDSPTKKPRGETSVKVMPLDYMKCDVRDLGIVISDMLMELIRINDPLPVRNEQLTRYHSRAPPGISVHDYLTRLIVHATLSPPILLSLVYYIDKLSALYPIFNISSLTVHRYLITAATVAAKGLSDSFWTNNTYARVGGISVRELALLELDFLERMDWRIVPPADILVDYYRNLVERNDNYALERQSDNSMHG